jgi:hypothetical protein
VQSAQAQGLGKGEQGGAEWQRPRLTGVEGEHTPTLTVHVVDQAAGEGLEQQAEDGHPGTEAACV